MAKRRNWFRCEYCNDEHDTQDIKDYKNRGLIEGKHFIFQVNKDECEEIQAKISWEGEVTDKEEFVKKCGEILRIAKPHLVGCDYKLGKELPADKFEKYLDDDEFVVVTCENGYSYKLNVTSIV